MALCNLKGDIFMDKSFVIGLASVILGCVGIGYAIVTRRRDEKCDLSDELDEDRVEKSGNVIENIIEEVKGYMSKKSDAIAEAIQFGKDILDNRSYRITLGLAIMGVGAALLVSGYMPLPE